MKIYLISICIFLITGCSTSDQPTEQSTYNLSEDKIQAKEKLGVLLIEKPVFDFGTIKAGDKVKHVFKITNKSKVPIIIKSATTSCGCTVAAYPQKPILFNAQDSIEVIFTSSLPGMQNKVININSNSAENLQTLTIIGKVVK